VIGKCDHCPLPAGCSRFGKVHIGTENAGRTWCETYLAARSASPTPKPIAPAPKPGPRPAPKPGSFQYQWNLIQACPWRVPLPKDKQEGCGCKHWCALGAGDRPHEDDKTTARHCLECVQSPGSPRYFAGV
jgi:hypothetical protein